MAQSKLPVGIFQQILSLACSKNNFYSKSPFNELFFVFLF